MTVTLCFAKQILLKLILKLIKENTNYMNTANDEFSDGRSDKSIGSIENNEDTLIEPK